MTGKKKNRLSVREKDLHCLSVVTCPGHGGGVVVVGIQKHGGRSNRCFITQAPTMSLYSVYHASSD
jgi:hypothetical protein